MSGEVVMRDDAAAPRTIGILGAGRFGTVIARQALRAGYEVLIAASGDPAVIEHLVAREAPGARPVTAAEAVRAGDVVVLAIPLRKALALDPAMFAGAVVVDAMNHWPLVDGRIPALEVAHSTSELVQAHLTGARVVKTLNHLGSDELESDAAPPGSPGRRALAVAGDDEDARRLVMAFVERLGYDAVDAGPLAAGLALEPRSHIFNGLYDRAGLEAILGRGEG